MTNSTSYITETVLFSETENVHNIFRSGIYTISVRTSLWHTWTKMVVDDLQFGEGALVSNEPIGHSEWQVALLR